MDKKELIQFLGNVKPLFDTLRNSYEQYERVEEQIAVKESQKKTKLSGGQIIGVIAGCFFYIAPGIIYYFYAQNSNKKQNELLEKDIQLLMDQRNAITDDLTNQIQTIQQTGIQTILPEQYLDATALDYIYGYLIGGRADNIKEALNLFEEEKHRLNMENMQYESLKQAQINNKLTMYGNIINAANAINNARR